MFDTLNAPQQAAVDHTDSPLLIVAGAGTGKTKTLAARVSRILDEGADPNRVLLLTFTRRAAAEMLARVAATGSSRAAAQVWGGTFHSAANRILRNFGQAAGLSSGFTVLDQGDATDLMGMVRTEEGFAERGKRFPRKETVTGIYSRMVSGQAKLTKVLETDYPWCADHVDDLKTIFTAYTVRKRANNVLDYDDMLLFWRGLTVSPVGAALRDLFDHVLIDEYQDTNPIQAGIVQGMCRPDTDLCVVGDDAQAIYGFRAATVANMWEFADHFPGATRVTLEQNYRSTMPILAVANGVLGQSNDHFAKQLWSNRTSGVAPTLLTHHDESDQSRVVCESILDTRERGISLCEQAVLFRAGHHSDGLELELTRRDIPFVKYGGLKYLESGHIKDLLALLRILDNPADQLAWHRVLATMEGVGPATVRRLSTELGIVDQADDSVARFIDGAGAMPPAADTQAGDLREALAVCLSGDLTPSAQVDRLKRFCALVFPTRYDNAAARLADIDQLAASASAYTSRSRFLTELTLDPPNRTSDRAGPPHLDDDWLTLSTIHSAKGLEWRSVHLLHAADGTLPSDMSLGDEAGLAEELRLMYVALTRAKDELSVHFPLRFHVNRYANDDRHVYAQISRFIEPIRELFDEPSAPCVGLDIESEVQLAGVGVADEVDLALSSLWD
ncbi:MAG: ATP-dependent helicase [Acidimicrobiaceae bacterium]|jgi:DNA helicase II / ATP-dependent DNA helicase PcrA|nr:ATP-dependent helicase [Acidimicrobiaceae bacterium]